jgi:hypothetical protein
MEKTEQNSFRFSDEIDPNFGMYVNKNSKPISAAGQFASLADKSIEGLETPLKDF